MITREQVADLREGDVVELSRPAMWGPDVVIRGPLTEGCGGTLEIANYCVRTRLGDCLLADSYEITVVSRAPRPLYVNHDRTKPVLGDVARDADSDEPTTFVYDSADDWCFSTNHATAFRGDLPTRLRLLVDGETGQVVQ